MTPAETAALDYQAVLAEIRAEMARRRLTGKQLAHMVGMSQPTVSRRLLNGSAFTLPEVLAICSALGISLRGILADAQTHRPLNGAGASVVAGAGFEPATSGLRAQPTRLATIIPFPRTPETVATRGDTPISA